MAFSRHVSFYFRSFSLRTRLQSYVATHHHTNEGKLVDKPISFSIVKPPAQEQIEHLYSISNIFAAALCAGVVATAAKGESNAVRCYSVPFDILYALKQFTAHGILQARPGHEVLAKAFSHQPEKFAKLLKDVSTSENLTEITNHGVKYFKANIPIGNDKMQPIKFSTKDGKLGSVYESGQEYSVNGIDCLFDKRSLASSTVHAQVMNAAAVGAVAGVACYGGIRGVEYCMGLSEDDQWEIWQCLIAAGVVGVLAGGVAWWLVIPLFSAGTLVIIVVTLACGAVIRYVASRL